MFCVFPTGRLLNLVVRSDIDQTMIHMQKAIAVDISCVQAYDTIASIEMQRYLNLCTPIIYTTYLSVCLLLLH